MKKLALCLMSAILLLTPAVEATQLTAPTSTVSVSITIPESISVSCTPASVAFTGTPSAGSQPIGGLITCTVNWNLQNTRTVLDVLDYFSSDNPFGTTKITAGMITGSANAGTATPFSDTSATQFGIAGFYGPLLGQQTFTSSSTNFNGSQIDTLQLAVNNSVSIPPGTYTATLNVVALAP